MIKAVIFDLDNTLYNFDAANEFGIRALAAYTEPVFGWDYPRMKDLYEESREKLTERMGDVGSAHNRLLRFQNLLEEKKLPLHPHALEMAKAYWRGVLDWNTWISLYPARKPALTNPETPSSCFVHGRPAACPESAFLSATISSAITAAQQRPACRRAGLSRLGNKRITYVILKLLLPISPAWHSLV